MAEIAAAAPAAARAPSRTHRPRLIAGAGAMIILISAGAALLPPFDQGQRAAVIGAMMASAGLIEMGAGALRSRNRALAILPGFLTLVAGALVALHPFHRFVPSVWLVMGWLGARGLVLALSTSRVSGSVRGWTIAAAAMDLSLGAALLVGLAASTLTLTLFGVTPEIAASFAYIVALSFVATGMLVMEVAACERG